MEVVNIEDKIGKHCMITIRDIRDVQLIETIEPSKILFNKIVNDCGLTVVSEAGYQFQPIGATYIYVLSESHMSIHTYPEKNAAYMDIFCCNMNFSPELAVNIISEYFETKNIEWDCIYR